METFWSWFRFCLKSISLNTNANNNPKVKVCHKFFVGFWLPRLCSHAAAWSFPAAEYDQVIVKYCFSLFILAGCLCSPQTLRRSESRSQMWKDRTPEGDLFNFERFFGLCFIRSELRGSRSSSQVGSSQQRMDDACGWSGDNPTRD